MGIAAGGHGTGVDDVRAARRAVWVSFFVLGAVTATWAARIPAVQDRLGLSPGGLAVVALGIEAGALVGLPLGATAVVRMGSRRSVAAALVGYVPGVVWA